MTTTTTPETLREEARAHRAEAAASFERSDTDGFVSQWASGINARLAERQAEILEDGGMGVFPALFKDGVLVPAVIIETRYGSRWGVFETAEEANRYNGTIVSWLAMGETALAKKGYTMGRVERPAEARIMAPKGARGLSGAASAFVGNVLPKGTPRFDPAATVVTTDLYEEMRS